MNAIGIYMQIMGQRHVGTIIQGTDMGYKKHKRRQRRHTESRPIQCEGEYGFRGVMQGLLPITARRRVELGRDCERDELLALLGQNRVMLMANWLGLQGAAIDFDLLLDVYLKGSGSVEVKRAFDYEEGSYSTLAGLWEQERAACLPSIRNDYTDY